LVETAATAGMACKVVGDRSAVVENADEYAGHGGLIGDWRIAPFEKIARGPIRPGAGRTCRGHTHRSLACRGIRRGDDAPGIRRRAMEGSVR
jgi:hypothetical protein